MRVFIQNEREKKKENVYCKKKKQVEEGKVRSRVVVALEIRWRMIFEVLKV